MARDFNGTSDYIEQNSAVVTAMPLSMACWFYPDDLTVLRALMSIGVSAADTRVVLQTNATPNLQASTTNVAGSSSNALIGGAVIGVWQHACGVWVSSSDKSVFLNGTKASSVTNTILGTPTVTSFGTRYAGGVRGGFYDGRLAEAAIWDVALDDEEVASLALGYSPLLVRPTNLKSYRRLIGRDSPEIDERSGADGTLTGTAVADHPRIIYKRRHRSVALSAFVPFQYARPDSDITEGGWLPSSGGSLYAVVDELVADDADRMRSNTGAADDAVTLGLSDITTPEAGTVDITIRHRIGT